jgi:hypothetical protein
VLGDRRDIAVGRRLLGVGTSFQLGDTLNNFVANMWRGTRGMAARRWRQTIEVRADGELG